MFPIILQILSAALSIWASKEKTKYIDRLVELKTEYFREINKPEADRSDAVLDNLEFQLRTLALAFSAEVGT